MNVYDSDRMNDLMKSIGYENTEEVSEANMVIINTCHIREKAAEKLYCDLGRIKPFKKKMIDKGQEMIVAVAGCVGQAEGEEIFKRAPVVDIIVGPESYQTLPDLVGKVLRDKSKQIDLDFKPDSKFDVLRELTFENLDSLSGGSPQGGVAAIGNENKIQESEEKSTQEKTNVSSFVSIQEGCDKFCSFCVVPYTRGAEFSRAVNQVLKEAQSYASKGAKEIYLLGQNVNAYHGLDENGNPMNLANLIKEIAKIDAVKRIRYTTSHPKDMDAELIAAHGEIEKLMPFLHLPVQSGSNNILKAMNRKHTRQEYFKIIENIRKARPDIGLSSDFIVGFPGETDQDFEDTLDLVEKIGFSTCYSFKYSPRPGTPAPNMKQVDEEIKDKRLAKLQALLMQHQLAFNQKFEGQEMEILFDRKAKKSANQIIGKSPWLQSVVIDDADGKYLNEIVPVRILKARPSSLIAEILG